ncbi:ABC transporter [Tissierella sp. P1]|jgi:cell division transport system ATP-binding protein|uniref:cell division ATP-binding protein FtsE n=1 Tax=Tissierella TaxID=41273 RepID=UPI000BA10DB9|nr:ATP-binding cassette domain-containing protein [Tissierella sp. P1]MDU5080696.1 ATP-binding cassette domain-containing protein [Bacillota bacterium]OZV10903.1 ABC transporter [Tissierella sp. P1]
MIEAKNISLVYSDGTVGLKDVNIKIESGDIVYITGPSGSGKTSLLKLFMGIEYPTTGELKVLDLPMSKEQSANIRKLRRIIGPIFQEFKLIKGRTALENVMMGMRFLGIPPKQIKEESNNALIKVGLEHKRLSLVEHLSWGETQRVAIARAVARKPAIILADEPTGNLDIDNALNILELLTSFKNKDTSVIITTHATHLIEDLTEGKFIKVENGKVSLESRGEA